MTNKATSIYEIDNSKTKDRKKILISTIGTRGDVQPILALALELVNFGHRPIISTGPNFKSFVESYGLEFVPYGPDFTLPEFQKPEQFTTAEHQERRRRFIRETFKSFYETAHDCHMILAASAYHYPGRSIAEALKIPYICATFCPASIPSYEYPPARFIRGYNSQSQTRPKSVNRSLWQTWEKSQNDSCLGEINSLRNALELAPIQNVNRYILSDQPWLSADKTLGPIPQTKDLQVTQTGPWLLKDESPLSDQVEDFLQKGKPPIYIGFGSVLNKEQISKEGLVAACRETGQRAIIARDWASLDASADGNDILAVDSINHSKLFPRVAAVIHHGGAGTTTAAAIAGVPQIIVPYQFDQFYWAHRLKKLGAGVPCRSYYTLSVDSLSGALRDVLQPYRIQNAKNLAQKIELNGAQNAARLIDSILS